MNSLGASRSYQYCRVRGTFRLYLVRSTLGLGTVVLVQPLNLGF
jgi:hypothetical protein